MADGNHIYDHAGRIHRLDESLSLYQNLSNTSVPRKSSPKPIKLNLEQTLFLDGLGRFDFVAGDRKASRLILTMSSSSTDQVGKVLANFMTNMSAMLLVLSSWHGRGRISNNGQAWVYHQDKTGIIFSGLGWIRVSGPAGNQRVWRFTQAYIILSRDNLFNKKGRPEQWEQWV